MDAHELGLLCAVPPMLPTQPGELVVLVSQSISAMIISEELGLERLSLLPFPEGAVF